MRLQGKTALITGAGSGLGEAMALRFAAEGATIACLDLDGARAEATAKAVAAAGGKAAARALDVADEAQVVDVFAGLGREIGPPDILVNSAGIGLEKAALQHDAADFERILAINLTGSFLCAREAAKAMIAAGRPGRIVNFASVAGLRGSAGRVAYGASKGGVIIMTQVLAVELAQHGVAVNAIAPGPIETAMVKEMHSAVARAAWERAIPTGRYGQPEDVTGAAVFMASDEAKHVTGHVLVVDGGFAAAGLMFDTSARD